MHSILLADMVLYTSPVRTMACEHEASSSSSGRLYLLHLLNQMIPIMRATVWTTNYPLILTYKPSTAELPQAQLPEYPLFSHIKGNSSLVFFPIPMESHLLQSTCHVSMTPMKTQFCNDRFLTASLCSLCCIYWRRGISERHPTILIP